TIANGITLGTSGSYASPLTITSTGAVETTTGNAINGDSSLVGSVFNSGIVSTQTMGAGIRLAGGGYIGNLSGGQIIGAFEGVYISGTLGTVANTSTIIGNGEAVRLGNGGLVTNNKGALLTGYDGVYVGYRAAGTVTNAGTIIGTNASGSYA